MGSCDRLIICNQNFFRWSAFSNHGCKRFRILPAGSLRNPDNLIFRGNDHLFVELGESPDRLHPASDLCKRDDFSLFISLQNRLDVQYHSDGSGQIGESPALFQIHQVVHGKHVAHTSRRFMQLCRSSFKRRIVIPKIGSLKCKQSFPQGSTKRIYYFDASLRVLLQYFIRCDLRGRAGT